jgi:CBS domain-containing protein
MALCRHCRTPNIDGAEDCENCGQPLDDTHLPPPQNEASRRLLSDRVETLSPRNPITVAPATPVGDVLRLMVERKVGCVLVADGAKLLGIFSERDALRKIGDQAGQLSARPVSEFMTPKPETLMADAKIAFAVQRMDLGGFRHLPIVDRGGALIGVISARDILRYLTDIMTRGSRPSLN